MIIDFYDVHFSVDELVSHGHKIHEPRQGNGQAGKLENDFAYLVEWGSNFEDYQWTEKTGGNQLFNVMQPYQVVYIFRRSA